MIWLGALVVFLVLFGSMLAMAEAALTRMTRVRALALEEEGRRNAPKLVAIESDPPEYLNAIYLWVMLAQNGSAILVAILAERVFEGNIWITVASVLFTLLYFVLVEAMSKTFAILHSDRVALALTPVVVVLARILRWPTRILIGIANVLLPGKGLRSGPFISEEEIRQMAEASSEEGVIEEEEKELIHSIFEFGDTIVREVMTPEPDIVAVDASSKLDEVLDLLLKHGYSRIPVYKETLDEIVGIVYAKDVLRQIHSGKNGKKTVKDLARKAYFVPESKRVAELLKEMQEEKVHVAIVVDEYGAVAGLVTLEDLLEEIVGEIADEYDREEPQVEPAGDSAYRVNARLAVDELNELLQVELPNEEWDTVGGLLMGSLGRLPQKGEAVELEGLRFTAEQVQGRRIGKVLVERRERPEVAEGRS